MIPLHDDNPTDITPVVTVSVIVICCIVFFWQLSLGSAAPRVMYSLGMIPAVLFNLEQLPPSLALIPSWLTVFTSMFLHGGWMHLIGNMLYLWIFGNNVEDVMGHARFIVFYLVCGVIAAMSHAVIQPAISGILGAYLLLYPHARVLVVIPLGFILHTTRLAAGWVLGFWFVFQIINSLLAGDSQGGVAWGAHIGGFVAGMALIPLFRHKGVRLFAPARRNYR